MKNKIISGHEADAPRGVDAGARSDGATKQSRGRNRKKKAGRLKGLKFAVLSFFALSFVSMAPHSVRAAAPAYQAFSAIASSTGADVTVTLPAHVANDIFLIEVIVRDVNDTITWPSGWTQIATVDRGTTARYWWAWKRAASASETNPLVDKSTGTGDTYAAVITYRGAITTGDPWEVKGAPQTGTADPTTLTGITTLTAESLVVAAVAGEDDNNSSITTTGTDPSAYADHYVESSNGMGGDGVITFSEAARTAAGATGNVSVNWGSAIPTGSGGILLALKSAPILPNVSGVSASPNPFLPPATTTISYSLANSSLLWTRIYDGSSVLQRKLVTPASYTATNKSAGANSDVWDGKNDAAATLGAGTYPYRIDGVYYAANFPESSIGGSNPQDVAIDPSNTSAIWMTDKTSPYVFKSTNGGSSWTSVWSTGADAKAYGIAIGNDGANTKIYIGDDGKGVVKSTNGGSSWSTVNPGALAINDVAASSNGAVVYALDYANKRVYKSTNSGTSWSQCAATGLAFGATAGASGIGTSADGSAVIVADSPADKLFKSTDGCSTFGAISAITTGTSAGQVNFPYQVEVQADGSFWVSERDNNRIQLFDSSGSSLMVVGGTGTGTGNFQFNSGAKYFGIGIAAISGQPHIFIADYDNTRVKKLGYDNWASTTHLEIGSSADSTPPAVGAVTPSNTATATHVDGLFDLSAAVTEANTVSSCEYTINGSTWLAATVGGSAPNWTCTKTGITSSDGAVLSLNMRATDDSSNVGAGTAVSRTVDTAAPAAIAGLAAPGATTTSVTLTWSNPSDGAGSGNASFDVRYRVGSTFAEGDWATASQAAGEPAPPATGMTVGSLACATTYAFAVKTTDNVGNTSVISNAATASTSACGGDSTPPTFGNLGYVGDTGKGGTVTLCFNDATDVSGLHPTEPYIIRHNTASPATGGSSRAIADPAAAGDAASCGGTAYANKYDFTVISSPATQGDGVKRWFTVRAQDSLNNITTNNDNLIAIPYDRTAVSGYNMMGVPGELGAGIANAAIFGDDLASYRAVIWNQDLQGYATSDGSVYEGRGYLLGNNDGSSKIIDYPNCVNATCGYAEYSASKQAQAPAYEQVILNKVGAMNANLVANPCLTVVTASTAATLGNGGTVSVVKSDGVTAQSYADAVSAGYIKSMVYRWNPGAGGSYQTQWSETITSGSEPNKMRPFAAYWVMVNDVTNAKYLRFYCDAQ